MTELPKKRSRSNSKPRQCSHASSEDIVRVISRRNRQTVYVTKEALFFMTLHSSISNFEIIGWLGGYSKRNRIFIKKAYAVEECRTQTPTMNVEMDPVSAISVQEAIEQDGYRVVGWYHSHPKFPTNPSTIDIENQYSYQLGIWKDFIAGIINPCQKDQIELTFFNVSEEVVDEELNRVPHSVTHIIEDEEFNLSMLEDACKSLITNYSTKKGRINPKRKLKPDVIGIQRIQRNLSEVYPGLNLVQDLVDLIATLYKKD